MLHRSAETCNVRGLMCPRCFCSIVQGAMTQRYVDSCTYTLSKRSPLLMLFCGGVGRRRYSRLPGRRTLPTSLHDPDELNQTSHDPDLTMPTRCRSPVYQHTHTDEHGRKTTGRASFASKYFLHFLDQDNGILLDYYSYDCDA